MSSNRRRTGSPRASVRAVRALRPLALAACLAVALSGPPAAAADEIAANPAAAEARSYAIPGGPLAATLNRFAMQAGVTLAAPPALTQERTSAGLSGRYTVAEGLAELLRGHGLRAVADANGGYAIEAAAAGPDASPATADATLPTVQVVSNLLGEITEGSGSYTPGAIATATRMVLTPRQTPQSISVITRQVMDDFNLTTIDQVMQHTPGIAIVTYDSERTEYYARGFAIQNFQYDGIPMMRDSAYSAGNTLSDMAIYDRIEVLKGATGLLTGSGTPGATINLIRKKPTRDLSGHLQLGAGRWDTYRGEVDVGGPLDQSGSLRARGVAAYEDRGSNLDRYSRQASVFYGILEADLTPDTLLTIGGDRQDNKPEASTWGGIPLLNAEGGFNAMPRSFNNGADWSHWDQYTRTGFATLDHVFANGWVAKLQYNHQVNGYDANLGAAAAGFPNPADGSGVTMWVGQYIGRTTSDAFDGFVNGPFQLAGREHELVFGVSSARRRWRNDGWYDLPDYRFDVEDYYRWIGNVPRPQWGAVPDFTNDEVTRERGAYAAARWNLRDDLKLITGGRWSWYRNQVADLDESGVFVPYVGAVYDLGEHWSLYASYTSIFSPQSLQDERGRVLAPLEGDNYEIGAKAEFLDGRLNASAAVFRLEQDNFGIESGGRTPTGGVAYKAVQGVKTEGYEVEVSGRIAEGWQLQGGYSHHVSRQQGARVQTLTPANEFTLYASYQPGGRLKGLTVGGGARWQDETWGDIATPSGGTQRHTAKDYWVLDAMARYEFDERLSAALSVSNLLDKKYYTIFSWYSTYTWGTPRNVSLNVTYRF